MSQQIFFHKNFLKLFICRFLHVFPKPLVIPELKTVNKTVARMTARLHKLNMPIDKSGDFLKNTMKIYFKKIDLEKLDAEFRRKLQDAYDMTLVILSNTNSPVCFCHNDTQPGNTLKPNIGSEKSLEKSPEKSLEKIPENNPENSPENSPQNNSVENSLNIPEKCVITNPQIEGPQSNTPISKTSASDSSQSNLFFIDYEYSAYNNRAFDAGNYFAEWMYNYNDINEVGGYSAELKNYPSIEFQKEYAKAYLEVINEEIRENKIQETEIQETKIQESEISTFLEEARQFTLVSHCFWAIWCLINDNDENFDYMHYANCRLDHFFEQNGIFSKLGKE